MLTYQQMLEEDRKEFYKEARREGHREGHREGQLEGLREGQREGQRAVLLRLLARRFGSLPEAITARIGAAGSDEIERWLDRLLDATSLDDVFSAP